MKRRVRLAGTALLLAAFGLRVFRILGNWPAVRRFYWGGYGSLFWNLLALALFLGPSLAALSAGAALWLRWDRARVLGTWNVCAGGAVLFLDSLMRFARWMGGQSGYCGEEPLLDLLVLAVSLGTVFFSRPPAGCGKNHQRNEDCMDVN